MWLQWAAWDRSWVERVSCACVTPGAPCRALWSHWAASMSSCIWSSMPFTMSNGVSWSGSGAQAGSTAWCWGMSPMAFGCAASLPHVCTLAQQKGADQRPAPICRTGPPIQLQAGPNKPATGVRHCWWDRPGTSRVTAGCVASIALRLRIGNGGDRWGVPTFRPVPTKCLGGRKTAIWRAIPPLLPLFTNSSREVSRLEQSEQTSGGNGFGCSNHSLAGWNNQDPCVSRCDIKRGDPTICLSRSDHPMALWNTQRGMPEIRLRVLPYPSSRMMPATCIWSARV